MNRTEPNSEELLQAYKQAKLRSAGVTLFKALNTQAVYLALKNLAIARRNKQQHPATH
jgi:hypothetical protein